MLIQSKLQTSLSDIVEELGGERIDIQLEHPQDITHGDYATSVAFVLSKKLKMSPMAVAETIKELLIKRHLDEIGKVSIAAPGFVNISLTKHFLIKELARVLFSDELVKSSQMAGKRVLIEYAHPNTHKEMHIGHMRTLITGEALARILQAAGATVFRANYQGDIGPHVAKALFGIQRIMEEEGLQLNETSSWSNSEKAHFLGKGYAVGSKRYEENKYLIDNINMQLYANKRTENNDQRIKEKAQYTRENSPVDIKELYKRTRQWSLDYYDEFYGRFGTKFDQLFFESEMAEDGVALVKKHVGTIFTEENGAIIFKGEEYGLHTRVFITQKGTPTYEAKDIANAYHQYASFPFDINIHVVANEQAGYFKVVIQALELIDPQKFKDKQFHLSMGMVNLIGRKMSSRTGDVLTVDWLLDQIKEKVDELVDSGRIEPARNATHSVVGGSDKKAELSEQIIIGAVKHSVLKVGVGQDVSFDINTSVSLEGNSGPYLQYTYARTQSVLRKSKIRNSKSEENVKLAPEEMQLLRLLSRFDEVIIDAAEKYSPNTLTTYLYQLASAFNLFYQKHQIIKSDVETKEFRLALTAGVGKTVKKGLYLLGIEAPEEM